MRDKKNKFLTSLFDGAAGFGGGNFLVLLLDTWSTSCFKIDSFSSGYMCIYSHAKKQWNVKVIGYFIACQNASYSMTDTTVSGLLLDKITAWAQIQHH